MNQKVNSLIPCIKEKRKLHLTSVSRYVQKPFGLKFFAPMSFVMGNPSSLKKTSFFTVFQLGKTWLYAYSLHLLIYMLHVCRYYPKNLCDWIPLRKFNIDAYIIKWKELSLGNIFKYLPKYTFERY